MKIPCTKECPERCAGCHGKCPAYMEYWTQHRKELDERKELCKIHDYVYDSIHRAKTSTREGREKYA